MREGCLCALIASDSIEAVESFFPVIELGHDGVALEVLAEMKAGEVVEFMRAHQQEPLCFEIRS